MKDWLHEHTLTMVQMLVTLSIIVPFWFLVFLIAHSNQQIDPSVLIQLVGAITGSVGTVVGFWIGVATQNKFAKAKSILTDRSP